MIERLASLLGALDEGGGSSPTAREVAELLWLARALPQAEEPVSSPQPGAAGRARPEGDRPREDPAAEPPVEAEAARAPTRLYLPGAQEPTADGGAGDGDGGGDGDGRSESAATGQAAPVRVSGPATLPQLRELARALRPLRRPIPSTVRTVLDEDATAGRIADHRHWLPVLVPTAARWLDVSLVIDAYETGAVFWEHVGHDLRALLFRLGAFRDVRLHHLLARGDGTAGLGTGPTTPVRLLRSPASATDPNGRTLTLVLTDGVAPAWRTSALLDPLRTWARCGPTAILQTLPERVWDQTALAPEPGRFRTTESGSPNARLVYDGYRLTATPPPPPDGYHPARGPQPPGRPEPPPVPVPVLGLTPEWLAPWARAIAAPGCFDSAAVLVPGGGHRAVRAPETPEPRAGFEEFRARAHPDVFRLAACLAAAPLNLAVMRTVQSALLPASPPSDLAEIVYSGLLHRVGRGARTDGPLDRAYDFAPGVRERLLATLRRDEADEVLSAVSAYVDRHAPGFGARFTAAVAAPDGPLTLPVGARHWAEVYRLVSRRQGRGRAPRREAARPLPSGVGPRAEPATEPTPVRDGRRFLITIGVSRYGSGGDLPGVPHDVRLIRDVFEAIGYEHVLEELGDSPTASAIRAGIGTWAAQAGLGSDDAVVVYYAGHGDPRDGRMSMLAADFDRQDPATALPVDVACAGLLRGGPGNLLFLMDAVSHREGLDAPLQGVFDAVDASSTAVWAVTMPISDETPEGGGFARAFGEVLDRLEAGPGTRFIGVKDVVENVRKRLAAGGTHRELTLAANRPFGTPAPFFPNPFYAPSLSPGSTAITNRAALAALSGRLRADDGRMILVVGSRGSGKSTLLNTLSLLARPDCPDRDLLPEHILPPTDLRYVGLEDVTGLAEGALDPMVLLVDQPEDGDRRRAAAAAINALARLPHVRVVATADEPQGDLPEDVEIIDLDSPEYRLPMDAYARCLAAGIHDEADRIDEVAAAIEAHSGQSHVMARLLAQRVRSGRASGTGPFRGFSEAEIGSAVNAFVRRFGPDDVPTALHLLQGLAYAEGDGVPAPVWLAMTAALTGGQYATEDIARLRGLADGLLTEAAGYDASGGGTTVFRLPHPSLAAALLDSGSRTEDQAVITRALRALVPLQGAGPGREWRSAAPYLRRHLAAHAAAGGVLEELLDDIDYVVAAVPSVLARALAESGTETEIAQVYLSTLSRLAGESILVRRDLLAFAALRQGDRELARALAADRGWRPVWAAVGGSVTAADSAVSYSRPVLVTGDRDGNTDIRILSDGERLVRAHGDSPVASVTCVVLDTLPHAVVGRENGRIDVLHLRGGATRSTSVASRPWELAAGVPVAGQRPHVVVALGGGEFVRWPVTSHDAATSGQHGWDEPVDVACAVVDGRALAVVAAGRTLFVQDVTDDQLLREQRHASRVLAVSCTATGLVVAGTEDGRIHLWDLASGTLQRTLRQSSPVTDIVTGTLGGRPHAVATRADGLARVWDLTRPDDPVLSFRLPEPADFLSLADRFLTVVIHGDVHVVELLL
ncbi:SAV_2336 N-terminal domain-related protein [Streptomyces sp. NPDC085481]|uniref:SAV_2336 N-terminal domain-related protein n=1 Tax=Streptomyces sp. NPDC085481 TaxID=3365727 RepID=UPI0037CCDAB7